MRVINDLEIELSEHCLYVDMAREDVELAHADVELARADLGFVQEELGFLISERREMVCYAVCEVENLELAMEDKHDCVDRCTYSHEVERAFGEDEW